MVGLPPVRATCVGLHFLRFRKACAFDVCTALRDPKSQESICKASKIGCLRIERSQQFAGRNKPSLRNQLSA